jgi:hypothetical protein
MYNCFSFHIFNSQIWLNLLMDDHHLSYIKKLTKKRKKKKEKKTGTCCLHMVISEKKWKKKFLEIWGIFFTKILLHKSHWIVFCSFATKKKSTPNNLAVVHSLAIHKLIPFFNRQKISKLTVHHAKNLKETLKAH